MFQQGSQICCLLSRAGSKTRLDKRTASASMLASINNCLCGTSLMATHHGLQTGYIETCNLNN